MCMNPNFHPSGQRGLVCQEQGHEKNTTCWHVGRSMIVWDVGSFDTRTGIGGRKGDMAFVSISVGSLG